MWKIIYGLTFALLCSFMPLHNTLAEDESEYLNENEAFDIAFYYASSRYKKVDRGRVSSFYRSRHKYYSGHDVRRQQTQRQRQVRYARRAQPVPPVRVPPDKIASSGHPTFIFNPNELNWGAYDASGKLLNYGRASGGKDYCADIKRGCKTPSGSFSVYRKGGAGCKSSKFPLPHGGAPMGWCMFFRGGYAIHASNDVPQRNVSHGCIRVKPHAAKWLSHQFMKIGTKVIVHGY